MAPTNYDSNLSLLKRWRGYTREPIDISKYLNMVEKKDVSQPCYGWSTTDFLDTYLQTHKLEQWTSGEEAR